MGMTVRPEHGQASVGPFPANDPANREEEPVFACDREERRGRESVKELY